MIGREQCSQNKDNPKQEDKHVKNAHADLKYDNDYMYERTVFKMADFFYPCASMLSCEFATPHFIKARLVKLI